MINLERNNAAELAVELGLLIVSPEKCGFPGRKGGGRVDVIVDVRGSASEVTLRTFLLGRLLVESLKFRDEQATIGGISRGGVMLGSQLALVSGRPFSTVLPEGPRESGLRRSVEGSVSGRNVIIFDNAISTGASIIAAERQVKAAGGIVIGALAVVAYSALPEFDFPLHYLFHVRELVNAAYRSGRIEKTRYKTIQENL